MPTRRHFLQTTAATTAAVGLAGCSTDESRPDDTTAADDTPRYDISYDTEFTVSVTEFNGVASIDVESGYDDRTTLTPDNPTTTINNHGASIAVYANHDDYRELLGVYTPPTEAEPDDEPVQENAQAGVSFDEDVDDNEVTVQLVSMENADRITIDTSNDEPVTYNSEADDALIHVGDTATVTNTTAGETSITVIGHLNDKQTVIQTYTVR